MQKTTLQVCQSLIEEHRQMEKLLDAFERGLETVPADQELTRDAWAHLNPLMAPIAHEMDVHFSCEEDALFPAVSPYHSMVLMEVEHEELMTLRNAILDSLALERMTSSQLADLKEIGKRFVSELYDHIGREDAGIFPTCERALSDDEKQQVIEDMDRIRAQAREGEVPVFTRPERSFEIIQVALDGPMERPVMVRTLAEKDELMLRELTVQAGATMGPYWSPRPHVLVCLQGEGTFIAAQKQTPIKDGTELSDGIRTAIQAGSVIMIDAQLMHAIEAASDCRFALIAR